MATSFAQFRSALQASAFGVVLAITACASAPPPTEQLASARAAVSRADAADADQYAADDLAQARSLLEQAQRAAAAGRDEDARSLAALGAAYADLANARSRDAVANTDLAQRRAEIADLKRRLRMGDDR